LTDPQFSAILRRQILPTSRDHRGRKDNVYSLLCVNAVSLNTVTWTWQNYYHYLIKIFDKNKELSGKLETTQCHGTPNVRT